MNRHYLLSFTDDDEEDKEGEGEGAEDEEELTAFDGSPNDSMNPLISGMKRPQRSPPSKDSPLRWISLVVYLVTSTPLIIAMAVLIGMQTG